MSASPDEREVLLRVLADQRTAVRTALLGLSEEQARATPSASSLSLAALVEHLTQGERAGIAGRVGGRPAALAADPQADWLAGFDVAAEETVAVLLDRWMAVARETEEVVRAEPDLDRVVELSDDVARWMPADTVFEVRWMVLHQIEEQARHAGHADVLRESIDGASARQLAAEAQGAGAP
ncbi:mycothiol transferase [Geodermatophilus sp. URMC 63]